MNPVIRHWSFVTRQENGSMMIGFSKRLTNDD